MTTQLPHVVRLIGTGKNPRGLARTRRSRYRYRIGDIVIRSGHSISVRSSVLLQHAVHVAELLEAGVIRVYAEGRDYGAEDFRDATSAPEPEAQVQDEPSGDGPKEEEDDGAEEEEEDDGAEEEEEEEENEEASSSAERVTLPEGWEKMNKAGLEALATEVGATVEATDTKRTLVEKISATVKG
jgi:hypothetical protein